MIRLSLQSAPPGSTIDPSYANSVASSIGGAINPDPTVAVRDMRLRGKLFTDLEAAFRKIGLALEHTSAPDRYGGSESQLTLVRRDPEIALLQIEEWFLRNPGWVGLLDSKRHSLKGRTVRIFAEATDSPKWGYREMVKDWRERDDIDVRFVPWTDVEDFRRGELDLTRVLGMDLDGASSARPGVAQGVAGGNDVFISYSHKDREWLERIRTLLAPLERNGLQFWGDDKIAAGDDWAAAIEGALSSARVAVLLVSGDFLASNFINREEFPTLLKAARDRGLTIYWIYLAPCLYEETALRHIQSAYRIDAALSELPKNEQDKILTAILREIAKELRG